MGWGAREGEKTCFLAHNQLLKASPRILDSSRPNKYGPRGFAGAGRRHCRNTRVSKA
jgi:hypothetical protein